MRLVIGISPRQRRHPHCRCPRDCFGPRGERTRMHSGPDRTRGFAVGTRPRAARARGSGVRSRPRHRNCCRRECFGISPEPCEPAYSRRLPTVRTPARHMARVGAPIRVLVVTGGECRYDQQRWVVDWIRPPPRSCTKSPTVPIVLCDRCIACQWLRSSGLQQGGSGRSASRRSVTDPMGADSDGTDRRPAASVSM
jgi:hypothetical protein